MGMRVLKAGPDHSTSEKADAIELSAPLTMRVGGLGGGASRSAPNLYWHPAEIQKSARAAQKLQKPVCLWLTGLSASGKSTIANLLEMQLYAAGKHSYILDGDNVRHGLNCDLRFSESDRMENIRRVTEVARLFLDAGLISIVSLISPFRMDRYQARQRFEPGEFIEIFIDAPLEECERRDPKGLYAKARRGELANFTGIDSVYEPPELPEIHLDTTQLDPEECVDRILSFLGVAWSEEKLDAVLGTSI